MSPEQRREMIVRAALPLVAEYGASVTTAQVARAAGIGEATIFRAFTDKDSLLAACMAEAMRPDHVVRELASVSLDQPLAARLLDAADALSAFLARMGAIAGALHASGHLTRAPERGAERKPPRAAERDASLAAIQDALAELFEPDRASLRLPPERLADVFGMLMMSAGRMRSEISDQGAVSTRELVDLFLHGAVTDGGVDTSAVPEDR
ncbi:TetR/AcrR family transcriptional regulator [Goodfellowiella coeruleoviolacea]|uniref:Transcriptional regulator, TetR family n=1 Tax=Goodfellowiella coeruleoviolacea TaxID=334858 RepID=A0AAE3G9W5_9PSEU|nr:TetR/AcrR family transcriptional regulator [Goodfellowiella coeruleoviolacea]MCP2164356.1 transcriptional regulator, TetR family [Goodfellowiella coeruleoviolacea]